MFQQAQLEKIENQLINQIRQVDENQCTSLSNKINSIQEKYQNTFEFIQDMTPIAYLEQKCVDEIDQQSKIKKSEIQDENYMDVLKQIYHLINEADQLSLQVTEALQKVNNLIQQQQALTNQYSQSSKASKQQMNNVQLNQQLSQLYVQFNSIFDQANIYLEKYDEIQIKKQQIIKKYGDIDQIPAVQKIFTKNVKVIQQLIEIIVEQFCSQFTFQCKSNSNQIQTIPINNQLKLFKENILFLIDSNQLSLKIIKQFNPNKYHQVKQLILQQLSTYFVNCSNILFQQLSLNNFVLVNNCELQQRIIDLQMFNDNQQLIQLQQVYDLQTYQTFNELEDFNGKSLNQVKLNKAIQQQLQQIKTGDFKSQSQVTNMGFENQLMQFFLFVVHFIIATHDSIEFLFQKKIKSIPGQSNQTQQKVTFDSLLVGDQNNQFQLSQELTNQIITQDFQIQYKNIDTICQALFGIVGPLIGKNEYYDKQQVDDQQNNTMCQINRQLQAVIKTNILLIFPMKSCIKEMQSFTERLSQFQQLQYIKNIFNQLFGFMNSIYTHNVQLLTTNLQNQIQKIDQSIYQAGVLQITQKSFNLIFQLIINQTQFDKCVRMFAKNFNIQTDYLYKDCVKLLQSEIKQMILQCTQEQEVIKQQQVNKSLTYTQQQEFQKLQDEQVATIDEKIQNLNDISDQMINKIKKIFITEVVQLNTTQTKVQQHNKKESDDETQSEELEEIQQPIQQQQQQSIHFEMEFLQLINKLVIKSNEHINILANKPNDQNILKYIEIAKLQHMNAFNFVLNNFNQKYNTELSAYLTEQINYNIDKYLLDQMMYKLEWVKFLQQIEELLKQNYVMQDISTMKNLGAKDCIQIIKHINDKKNQQNGFKEISSRIQKHIGVTHQKISPCISNQNFIFDIQKAFKKFLYFKLNTIVDEKYKRLSLLIEKCYSNKLQQDQKNLISSTEMLQQLNIGLSDFLK